MRAPALLLAGLLAACNGSAAQPPPSPDPCALGAPGAPWLAFASRRTGDYEIWRARADATCLLRVTDDPAADLLPTWAGATIVFESERRGIQELWAHDLATGDEHRLDTSDLESATAPAFSPDGSRLAFEGRASGASASDVYVMPAVGGLATPLEATPEGGAGPAWAPDGQTVYFVSPRSGWYDVWAVPAAGGEAVPVTTRSGIVGKPAVSADGTSILYARPAGATTEVVRQDLATGTVTLVSSLDDSEPALSPDGQRVALRTFRAGHADVVVEGLDGSAPVFVTSDVPSDGAPSFARAP